MSISLAGRKKRERDGRRRIPAPLRQKCHSKFELSARASERKGGSKLKAPFFLLPSFERKERTNRNIRGGGEHESRIPSVRTNRECGQLALAPSSVRPSTGSQSVDSQFALSASSLFVVGHGQTDAEKEKRTRTPLQRRMGARSPGGLRSPPLPPLFSARARSACRCPPASSLPRPSSMRWLRQNSGCKRSRDSVPTLRTEE